MMTKKYTLTLITYIAVATSLVAMEPGEQVTTPDTIIEPGASTTATQNPYVRLSQEEKDNQFIQEVAANHPDNVCRLIEAKANVNYVNDVNTDALGAAFEHRNLGITEILLAAGAIDNTDAISFANEAIRTYEEVTAELITMIIKANAMDPEDYDAILGWAIKRGHAFLADLICTINKEFSKEEQMCAWYKRFSVDKRNQLLIQAIKNDDLEETKILLNAGVDSNAREQAIRYATDHERPEIVKMLTINMLKEQAKNEFDYIPLIDAINKGDEPKIRELTEFYCVYRSLLMRAREKHPENEKIFIALTNAIAHTGVQ